MSTSTSPQELLRDPPPGLRFRRSLAVSLALALGATGVSAAVAVTKVTETNKQQLTAVGPVSSKYGFPAWYEDRTGTRLELCDDGTNPLCGLAPEEGFDPEQPLALPGNFPHEIFYMLAGSELDLPGGGSAVLTLGLEAAFANEVAPGEQMVFARQRLVVKDGPANSTLSFPHPYGTIEVDTDAEGNAKLVEDISPAVGNFETPLGSNLGPFLKWDTGAPAGYLGNPDVPHRIVGGLRTTFSVSGTNAATGEAVAASTDQFTVQGKIATNTGVKAEQAVATSDATGTYLDVFATSRGDTLEVSGQGIATTPLEKAPGTSELAYARVKVDGALPSEVTVTNLADDPQSTSTVGVSDVSVPTSATYDGTKLTVVARTTSGSAPKVDGFGDTAPGADGTYQGSFDTVAPPVNVTVSTGTSKATVPVVVTDGPVSPVGVPAPPEGEDPGPVTETEGGTPGTGTPGTGTPPADAEEPTAAIAPLTASVPRGIATELDGSGSTDNAGAVTYEWSQVSGPEVAFDRKDVAKPKVTVPFFTTTGAAAPVAPDANPVLQLVVTDPAGNKSAPATITLNSDDEVTIAPGARFRAGKEFRLGGTAVVQGAPTLLQPPTSVNVYDMAADGTSKRKLGTAQVDTLGNWELRLRPAPSGTVANVLVQSTRGGEARGAVAAG
ncbi:hypothetical protein [Kocuria sp. CNJ-770]|uniref:hypothetical protein n=1 Tax=Kocuria sp. CNJ-770 TaxID=1904964 RepID=UPI000B09CCFF|nr:hypothetical protein [Kocuria sp. CNJ-770]